MLRKLVPPNEDEISGNERDQKDVGMQLAAGNVNYQRNKSGEEKCNQEGEIGNSGDSP